MRRAQKSTLRRDGAAWVITTPSGGTWMMGRRRLPGTGVWEEAVHQAHQIALETQIRDVKHAELFPPDPYAGFKDLGRMFGDAIHAYTQMRKAITQGFAQGVGLTSTRDNDREAGSHAG